MPKFFIKSEQNINNQIFIKGADVNHIKNVLRAKSGDTLEVCNSETSTNFVCQIEKIDKEEVQCKIIETLKNSVEPNTKVTIFQGLPKSDKMEYIIQKSVELGANDITPVEMKRCVVKLNEKDKTKKIQRWQKISEVAAKQCGRDIIPNINNIINIKQLNDIIDDYDVLLVAYEEEKENTLKSELKSIKCNAFSNIGIVIGPEGGLEKEDVKMLKDNGAHIITLGKRILRTETVALNVLSNIMYELEN